MPVPCFIRLGQQSGGKDVSGTGRRTWKSHRFLPRSWTSRSTWTGISEEPWTFSTQGQELTL